MALVALDASTRLQSGNNERFVKLDRAFGTLMTFIASQLVVMALGMLPLKYWRGIQARGKQVSADRVEPLLTSSHVTHEMD